jgi:hypothetical protein
MQLALDLRATGASYEQIGKALDPPVSAPRAWKIVQKGLEFGREKLAESAKNLIQLSLNRLNRYRMKLEPNANDPAGVNTLVKIIECEAKLTGINAPVKVAETDLFGDDAVGPFDQRNENGRIAELCIPIRKIVFRDPTGPGASSSSKDRNVFGDDLLAQLAKRRPTNGNHRVRGSFAHKIVRVSSQEYLNFVASVRQRQCMREHERRSSWVVGPPRTSH